MNTTSLKKLALTALTTVLFAQAAIAGPPPPRGGGAPPVRKPGGQPTEKRVCIDLGISKPIIRTIPTSRWPYGVKPDGKTVFVNMTTVVRNNSTTDLNEPYSIQFSVFNPTSRQWQSFLTIRRTRGLAAGRSERLDDGRYWVVGPWPDTGAVRAEFVGSRSERNDCTESNDQSQPVIFEAQRLATEALNRP